MRTRSPRVEYGESVFCELRLANVSGEAVLAQTDLDPASAARALTGLRAELRRRERLLAAHGGPVPWWRVVRADGSLPPSHHDEARQSYLEEGTPLRPSGNVDINRAFWSPT